MNLGRDTIQPTIVAITPDGFHTKELNPQCLYIIQRLRQRFRRGFIHPERLWFLRGTSGASNDTLWMDLLLRARMGQREGHVAEATNTKG